MSYLAIARKYRPATFDEIVGQEHVTRTLRNAIQGDRIHHAYLFCGARGVGKTTAARALAKSLNCEHGPTAEPCGICTSCREIAHGSSPDLIEIDGASNNSVDDVRDLRETVHYAPTHGRYKVYLVDEVHMLSKAAFNALLKTLEEPPPHVVFIFATTEPHRILDTILSRVQRFDFKRIGVPALVERLRTICETEGASLSDTALLWIARAGEGSMRDAQSLLDKVISFGTAGQLDDEAVAEVLGLIDRALLLRFVRGLLEGDAGDCLDVVAEVYDFGHELSQFTADLLEMLRDATFVAMAGSALGQLQAPEDEVAQLREIVQGVPVERLTRLFNALLDAHDQVSRASRPRIVLEMAVARLATTREVQPVSELIGRLEQLERSLPRGGARGSSGGSGGSRSGPQAPPPRAKSPPPSREVRKSEPRGARSKGGGAPRQTRSEPRRPPDPEPEPEPDPAPGPPPAGEARPPEPAPSVDDRWKPFANAIRPLGRPGERLATGIPEPRDGALVVRVRAGRTAMEARRAIALDEVQAAFRTHFPDLSELRVLLLAGTGTAAERQRALQQEVMDDPECRRVIEVLGAEIETVKPLRDDP